MKLIKATGSTSVILEIFIQDNSVATGAGLTGLVFNTAGLTCYYHRETDVSATSVSLVTMTVGTFTSSGFKEVDATNMPGVYQLCLPNAAFASGAKHVTCILKGASNMAPVALEIQLNSFDLDTANYTIANIWAQAMSDLSAVPGATSSALQALNWLYVLARNKRTQTSATETVFKDDGATSAATSTKSDDGTTFTRGKYS